MLRTGGSGGGRGFRISRNVEEVSYRQKERARSSHSVRKVMRSEMEEEVRKKTFLVFGSFSCSDSPKKRKNASEGNPGEQERGRAGGDVPGFLSAPGKGEDPFRIY